MVTASRVTWFVIALLFVVPSMLLMFRGSGELTREVWGRSVAFAVAIALVAAVLFGKGRQ